MSENEATSDQDDVSFIRTDDMVCLQCSETGERVCLAAEGFGNRHCFLEPIANKNYPPEMPSCVFVIEQALSVRALQEMVTAESSDLKQSGSAVGGAGGGGGGGGANSSASGASGAAGGASNTSGGVGGVSDQSNGGETAAATDDTDTSGPDSQTQLSAIQLTSGKGGDSGAVGGGNRTLLYGHAVLLRHFHSGMYLATLPLCSSSDKLAFDVGLKGVDELGESCWWTVHPGSKQRSEGEKVRFGDDLILVSVATERYLHFTNTDVPLTPPMASATAAETAVLAGKQAIVNASFHSTHWSIAPFGTGLSRMKNVGYVFGGQVLRLLHGGDECLTVSTIQNQGQQQQQQQQQHQSQQVDNSNDQHTGQAPPLQQQQQQQNKQQQQQQVEVVYEGGAVMNQARSLWRLDLIRTKWSGGFVQYSNGLRIRHITTGKYLGVSGTGDGGNHLCLLSKIEATVERTAFHLRLNKDDSKAGKGAEGSDDKDEEVIGAPAIKYADTSFFIQHIDTQMWLSYRSYETKKRGIGRVEEKQAILLAEGKMDDCLEFSRSQEEEAKTARVIRKCDALFSKFIRILDHVQQLAVAQKTNDYEQLISNSLLQDTDLMDMNQARQQQGGGSKKRGSVATSAVAAAALSSLAPIFSSSAMDLSGNQAHQSSSSSLQDAAAGSKLTSGGGQQQLSGRLAAEFAWSPAQLFPLESQIEMSKCLEDLIDYFAPPAEGCDHEQEQNCLRALRNRQDLFQEEGILNLILDAIDKINLISGQGLLVLLLGEESSSTWESITGYFYQLLAAIIKDNHTNCAQFAQSHRLNWLFSRLSSQQASEGTGMLDVLHCVLVDSPEALNMLKESHIKVLISLLEKHGRDPKVLNVLCSLCVSNGVAIRSSQNTITNHLLPGRNLLLQTRLIDEVASMKPNIYIARVDGSAMYYRWYYEVIVDHIELNNNLSPHLRIGWANTKGYLPYPGGGQYWGSNGVGDDFYSYGFDGQYLWTAGRPTLVRIPPASTMTRHEVMNNQYYDYQNQRDALLESYAHQQKEFVTAAAGHAEGTAVVPPSVAGGTSDGLTSSSNIDSFAHSPYLRLQKNDVIGCLIDLSVPTIQFTINGKQIFGFFKNFNVAQGGFFHPVVSFSAKVSCRFLFGGGNQGELNYRPPTGFSPLADVLLPGQDVLVEPCFSFGDLAKQTVCGPQVMPDSLPQMVVDLIFIPRVIDTQTIELAPSLAQLRDQLAENMHELWCMSRIEDGWQYGEEHDEEQQTHPYIGPFASLPALGKKYKLDLASQTMKIILGLGYKITLNHEANKNGQQPRVKTYRLPHYPYHQALNDYKPAPLDLSQWEVTPKINQLVEMLAENIHNIWAAEKISLRWTYKRRDPANELDDDFYNGRSCHLLPYKFVDDKIKLKNRQSALETVLTIIAHGYHVEPLSAWDKPALGGAPLGGGDPTSMTPMIQETGAGDHGNLLSPSPQVGPGAGGGGGGGGSPAQARSPSSRPVSTEPLATGAGGAAADQLLSGYEVILNNAPEVGPRHYRAERTYAVQSGRWYYEVEICTLGHIQVGWANLQFASSAPSLGCDENSWAFDCHTGRKVHASNNESFGQVCQVGDVVGCMLDLNDRTISYSLNGKLMLDYLGNEMAFGSQELPAGPAGDAASSYVPAVSVGIAQRVRLCFGQDVEQLRYFTDYGLQEGYHPFCVNMHKPITLWYNKREPNFVSLDDLAPSQVNVEVTRIPPGSADSSPALKIAYKQFESQERANWEYLRLSLPVTINPELLDETDKIAKMQEIQAQQLRIAYSQAAAAAADAKNMGGYLHGDAHGPGGVRHPARLEQHMLQSGFSLADVKDLQRSYETKGGQAGQGLAHKGAAGGGPTSEQGGGGFGVSGYFSKQQQQRRHAPLTKTRSVDEHKSSSSAASAVPSLAVPSFTEAQRMMAETKRLRMDRQRAAAGQQQQGPAAPAASISRRRNTGFNLLRGTFTSMDDISMGGQQQQHQELSDLAHNQDPAQAKGAGQRSKTTLKSIFGSIKGRAPSEPPRSQSLSRQQTGDGRSSLMVPKISIQNQDQFGQDERGGQRSRSVSRAGSYSNLSALGTDAQQGQTLGRSLVRRLSRVGGLGGTGSSGQAAPGGSSISPGQQLNTGGGAVSPSNSSQSYQSVAFDLAQLDAQTLDSIDEYYYGVRIFPGQEPAHVLCGWVTSQFKQENLSQLSDVQHTQIVQSTSLITGQAEICERRECYLFNAGQLYKEMHPGSGATATTGGGPTTAASGANSPALGSSQHNLEATGQQTTSAAAAAAADSSSRSNRGMLVGCHVDTSTGMLTFTVDGKQTKYKFNLEPQTKLYPAIFFQATTGDCLQFELGRTAHTLPLSAAILSLTSKHVAPQCPPRLRVQTMRPCSWSRVPNVALRPNALKLSESKKGWSMLAVDPLSVLAVHIPEENRCLDILELIEHEKLLKFHSHSLALYGALCAQGNHKVAHIICSHVDQRQLLYAINSDYLSGDLRRGFADLLIALHLEFHAYGRHLTQNEFIVPITRELNELYTERQPAGGDTEAEESYASLAVSSLAHSFARIECVSIRTEMNMSPIGFDLQSIDASASASGAIYVKLLSTPYFPIGILKKLVFQALNEAVHKGNLPIRDLPGGSNESLFVPLLKLADKLLLIGCITNQDLSWLLNLIDPETFVRPYAVGSDAAVDTSLDPQLLAGLSFLAPGSNSPSSIWKPTILRPPASLSSATSGGVSSANIEHSTDVGQTQGGGQQHATASTSTATTRGLLQMCKLDEHVKLIICHLLHHLLDIQLRHRIESIMAFSVNFVGQLQTDQRRRYDEIKTSNLPSHLTARKTREFRCTPKEQMRYILNFKTSSTGGDPASSDSADSLNASPSSEHLRQTLKSLHSSMMKQIKVIIESSSEGASGDYSAADDSTGLRSDEYYARQRVRQGLEPADTALVVSFKKLLRILRAVKTALMTQQPQIESHVRLADGQAYASYFGPAGQQELKFIKSIVRTIVKWAEESTIENKQLVRQMFHLLLRCYNGVGELIEALNNSYVIGEKSKRDVIDLLQVLSKVRALLAVQMGPAEEEVMRDCLWTLVNNVVFFQHPDLIRILRVHENVMHVMMNTLSKRSRAQSATSSSAAQSSTAAGGLQDGGAAASGQTITRGRAQSIPGILGTANQQQQQQQQQQGTSGGQPEVAGALSDQQQEDDISKMVVSCCRFLCFFCRSSAKNQKAMFEHLGFLLENSNILLSRPSLRGSTPLDVAYSSLMENHELVLALRESYLEKIAIYLSRCGLQSNQELIDKGHPDVGWDPVEGERYLDFLRFCVWVNGESVEENSNLVIRLLIRRPECLGPALRGEGPGLFAAIKDAIAMADRVHADQQEAKRALAAQQRAYEEEMGQQQQGSANADNTDQQQAAGEDDENGNESSDEGDEDEINMGSATLNFYCALVDLLGRCAPDLLTIGAGKHESIRARSILKSLVPLQDLKSALSLRFALVNPQCSPANTQEAGEQPFGSTASSFMPNHKQSLVLFLERVYGIENQETFFLLLEEAFLPDMRAATMLEKCPPASVMANAQQQQQQQQDQYGNTKQHGGDQSAIDPGAEAGDESPENEMTLALNRYLGNSAIPLLIRESHYFKNAESYANLLEPTLHTAYRLSKVKILTKGQREGVSDFLIALTREMQPHQLLKLLRKLTVDVAVLNESTTVALRLLTLHYERCSKYYGYSGSAQTNASGVYGTATEEERRLTMVLFTNIFDSLSLMDYDPELFENALPCLNALACALPPDYSLTESREFSEQQAQRKLQQKQQQLQHQVDPQSVGPYIPQPVDTHQVSLNSELRQLAQRFSEHYHDAWASRKLDRDWTYGEQYNFKAKTHPRLKPYCLLTRYERDRYIEPIEEALKALAAMGWTIDRGEGAASSNHLQAARGANAAAGLVRTASRPELHAGGSSPQDSLMVQDPGQRADLLQNYNPQPVDTSNLSLSRELQNLAERSAENAHDLWARKTMEDWTAKMRANSHSSFRPPIMLHPLMVPYDLLTDKEKRKNRNRSQELLKYILFEGYKIYRLDDLEHQQEYQQQQQQQRGRINSRAGTDSQYNIDMSRASGSTASSKRRFAYSILDKLISYTDSVMVKMELLKPSANFSRRSSFRQSDRDVKFFSKVVLPLIERYFTAHRDFFLNYYGTPAAVAVAQQQLAAAAVATAGSSPGGMGGSPTPSSGNNNNNNSQQQQQPQGEEAAAPSFGQTTTATPAGGGQPATGYATIKEKEMLASLFCKLASVLRNKLSVIGPDAKIFVRCLQVLTRALDARSLSEQSPDFIKTSMLTYFNKTAQDLSRCVFNLQMKRYNAVRGTTMRTSSSLYHVHLAILPTLTALFDHLASSESGKYLLLDDIQVASQKILQSLYVLGTRVQLAGNHQFSRKELERHRHSYGNCLAALAAAFPIAFLEPEQLRFNRYSIIYTKRTQTLGGPAAAAAGGGRGRTGTELESDLDVMEMPVLPRLDELMKLVNKFVQTGKGPSSDNNHRTAPLGIYTGGSGRSPATGGSGSMRGQQQPAGQAPSQVGVAGLGGQSTGQSPQIHLVSSSSVGGSQIGESTPTLGVASSQDIRPSSGQTQRGSRQVAGNNTASTRMIPADNDAAIIEVIVPLLCSYLPFWYSQGPEASQMARQLGAGSGSTNVTSKHLNDLLKDIMHLIRRQVGVEPDNNGGGGGGSSFNWMVAIAAHASQIIIDSHESSLLSESFLPLSTKVTQRAENIYHREEVMRGYLKSAAEDTTAIEEKIQEEFHLLVRDIYAFYPLLIKYVDFKKSVWLKARGGGIGRHGPAGSNQHEQQVAGGQRQLNAGQQQPSQLVAALLGGGGDNSTSNDTSQALDSAGMNSVGSAGGHCEEQQSRPEQMLFHQVATVFDIWSNSQYFRREEQNFISLHEIDNMALIIQASNRPGRAFFQKSDPTQPSSSGGRKKKRRQSEKRDREREIASSLLVVALKRLLPIGMDLFEGRERELVQHVKERFLKKESPARIEEVVRHQLTQPYKIDPADEFGWQHYLYSRLGAQPTATALAWDRSSGTPTRGERQLVVPRQHSLLESGAANGTANGHSHQQQQTFVVDSRLVARIVDMARVFYGLHIIDHPNLQQKAGRRSCVSTQRRRVVIACFRMTSLHSLPSHRAINIFLRSYCDTWLLDENSGQERLIEDLTQTFEQAEMKGVNADASVIPRSDPLCQLIMTLSRQATTEHGSGGGGGADISDDGMISQGVDRLYLQFADIFRMSCGGDEEEEDEEEEEGEEGEEDAEDREGEAGQLEDEALEGALEHGTQLALEDGDANEDDGSGSSKSGGPKSSIHEQEIEKQRLLFQQSRLSDRGVAEMILLYISAFSRYQQQASSSSPAGSGAGGSSAAGSSAGGSSGSHNLSQHTPMILSTLKLGISILRGGNVEVQRRMLKHLKDKKDVGFFTSIQTLMNSCSVLDLDAFERNQKAEALGVRSEGFASEKNMYDAEFTCKLFRFFQLLCEGHNLEFQNYLRTQAGNTTTVNVVISTVDYLLRLQESIMDFYWHYSSKDVIDPSGTENFIKAITIAKQVFCTLTESIQGPCPQNQQALAHSRLWHAVGGFLFLFAHMQDKLSRNSSQLNLLIELLDLQKEMVIMMLSMLEGNVVNGTIGKQMVETLVESSGNVEIILKFFDMFLKLPRLTASTNFQEYDRTGSGWISLADLRRAMEQHKIYTPEETQYLLSCCEPNHDGMIDYREFIDRFHKPAKDIGFNVAVLLTNLAEHITNEPRLQRFLETASTVLNYFEPYLGRIEIMGSSKRIERVYFEIKESTLDQWAKPQIQESKRAFFYSIVTEGDGKEKLEAFVNFCEDTIFEMQHASNILGEDAEEPPTKADKYPFDAAAGSDSSSGGGGSSGGGAGGANSSSGGRPKGAGSGGDSGSSGNRSITEGGGGGYASAIHQMLWFSLLKGGCLHLFNFIIYLLGHLRPARIKRRWLLFKRMSWTQLVVVSVSSIINLVVGTLKVTLRSVFGVLKFIFRIMVDESTLGASEEKRPQQHKTGLRSASGSMFATDPSNSIAGRSQISAAGAPGVRTELITTPSVMRASVADVTQPDQLQHDKSATENGEHKQATTAQSNGHANGFPSSSSSTQMTNGGVRSSLAVAHTQSQVAEQGYTSELDFESDRLAASWGAPGSGRSKSGKSRGLAARLARLTNYNQKFISFLARNFYRIKLLALVTAFVINFILLFYKVSIWTSGDLMEASVVGGAGGASTLMLVAHKTLGGAVVPLDSSGAGGGESDQSSRRSKLDEIEKKIRRGFAHYEGTPEDEIEPLVESSRGEDEPDEVAAQKPAKLAKQKAKSEKDKAEDKAANGDESKEESADKEGDEEDDDETGEDDEDEETDLVEFVVMEEKYYYLQPILTFLATVHSIYSLCMLIAYYHLKVPLVIFKREKEIARKLEFDGLYITEEPDGDDWWKGCWDKLVISAESFPVNYWDKFVKKRVREKYREQYDYETLTNLLGMDKHLTQSKQQQHAMGGGPQREVGNPGGAGHLSASSLAATLWGYVSALLASNLFSSSLVKVDWRYQLWKAGVTLTDQSFQYQLLYLIFSLAGHFNYFFFAAHLLDVAVGFKKLQTILQSVTHNGKQLVLTVMLLTIVVYIYTVIAFNFFRKFYIQGDDSPDQKCHSMMTCFVYHLYQGVRAGGGIGDVIEAPDGDDYEVYRIIFDITFFFSVIIILLAIIQGLIIDAFGELRDQLLTVASDMESNCFICGIGKDVLDKVPRGFDTHVQKEHNLANYMFFLMHLINKPDTDYTGQETYVWELYQRRCWDFFPVGECFRTQSEEEADAKPTKD